MRVFFDTNVLVAAFISRGACAELFEHCLTAHTACTSDFVLNEFKKALGKIKHSDPLIDAAAVFIAANTLSAAPAALSAPICRDSDDDAILAGAVGAKADCIVTGDEDLLVLLEYEGIPILRPAEFWKLEREG